MNLQPITDLQRLCIHTITVKPWNIGEIAANFSSAGVKGITVWRDTLAGRDIRQTGRMLRDHGLSIVSLCRGGFFPSADRARRRAAIDDNRKAIEEAHELGTDLIVLVCGADPSQSLEDSRKQIHDGIASVLPDAESAGVRLAIEPLHPMFADTRSAINTLAQANDLAEILESPSAGVAVDVYHLWWDPDLEKEIKRSGKNGKLFAYHVSDWKSPTVDMLNDRGLMGEGCIPLKKIRSWVEDSGFSGFIEVEIFSDIYWSRDQHSFLQDIVSSYKKYV
ncbi:MAG TPA: sugar phosphate isomerase/epimerase family protein [Bacteroidales bacterium]|jgi:sugar phosphate isomerase/epimerase|nr:sugar phosphate isomerase/epimerase family protein [Bacteroidales bacterium]HOS70827.1 sugar phosphate isomerase/epimerase family protein [Bacteroidales bacterium]HQH24444.1 sugar phosphate isomerase/epimerase family protein [Bacteroidales bacterium]HQJ81423.1 sugar phosphate isomerase/epimerase family protein [Bacteroidales bacterium]